MAVKGLNPYDLADLLKGPCRVLYAPFSASAPEKLTDIIATDEGKYDPVGEWLDFGATTQGTAYSRQFATAGYQIEQASGNVDEEVTDVVRSVQLSAGQIDTALLQMMEEGGEVESVEAAKNQSAEKQIPVGTADDLTAYRVAFMGRRAKGQGADVTESGGVVRGALVAFVMLRAKLSGDTASLQLAKGQLASAPLTFNAYPDGEFTQGKEHGFWIVEQSGTISGV